MLGTKLDLQLTVNQTGPSYSICCPLCQNPAIALKSAEYNDKKMTLDELQSKSGYELLFSLSSVTVRLTYECALQHQFNVVLLQGHDAKIRLAFTVDTHEPRS